MARLIDELVSQKNKLTAWNGKLLDTSYLLKSKAVIVADGIMSDIDAGPNTRKSNNYPLLKLPFDPVFVEGKSSITGVHIGMFLFNHYFEDAIDGIFAHMYIKVNSFIHRTLALPLIRVNEDGDVLEEDDHKIAGIFDIEAAIGTKEYSKWQKHKELLHDPSYDFFASSLLDGYRNAQGDKPLLEAFYYDGEGVAQLSHFAYMTISLMNCKNVVMIDNPPPAKLSKRHAEKYGVPLVTYKTLKVLPMRKVNQNDYDPADTRDTSIPKSLHIARGHFKDYRNGPGLFGKYQDIFWWDAYVRGSAEKGVIVKDYDVQAPEPENA